MTIFVEVESNNNDAFVDDPVAEMARILRKLAERLEAGAVDDFKVYDINGAPCGRVVIEE